jgi:hypothetical protein
MSTNNTIMPALHDNDYLLKRLTWREERCPRLVKLGYCDGCPVFVPCRRNHDSAVVKSVNQNGLKKEDYQIYADKVKEFQEMVK